MFFFHYFSVWFKLYDVNVKVLMVETQDAGTLTGEFLDDLAKNTM